MTTQDLTAAATRLVFSRRPIALIARLSLLSLTLVLLAWFGRLLYFNLAPSQAFFQYFDVTAAEVNLDDGVVWVQAERLIRRDGLYSFRDDFECLADPTAGLESTWRTTARSRTNEIPTSVRPLHTGQFPWTIGPPLAVLPLPAVCRIESVITLPLPTDGLASQTIVGTPFEILEDGTVRTYVGP